MNNRKLQNRSREPWSFGPKFSEYLSLNFKMISYFYGVTLAYTLCYGALYAREYDKDLMQYLWLFLMIVLINLVGWTPKFFRESAYDGGAALYASIPVSSFETVMARMIASAMGVLIALITLGMLMLFGLYYSDEKWIIFVSMMWSLGFSRTTLTAGLVFGIWIIAALAFVSGGISLFAFAAAHHFAGSRFWLQWLIAIPATVLMLAVGCGVLVLIWMARFLPVMARLIIMLAVCLVMIYSLIRLNLAALEKWYSL